LSGIKKLAGQTLWYGVPTIANRFLGYIMNLTLPLFFAQPATTADLTQIYAMIPFFNVLFTYGLETAYFRFSQEEDKNKLYSTLSISLLVSSVLFCGLLWLCQNNLSAWANLENNPTYIKWMIGILFFDNISTLAFARLRQENKPRKFAFVRVAGIVLNVLVVFFFLAFLPSYLDSNPSSILRYFKVRPEDRIVYYLIGNLCGSVCTFLLLRSEFSLIRFYFNKAIWKKVIHYALPLIIVGMGGMVNDMLSRLIYQHVVDLPEMEAKHELGIFGNIYRLAVLITIAIQAFRMAAEPFFFKKSTDAQPQRVYARIMKFFVIVCCFLFLGIALFIDVFKWFFVAIDKQQWVEGLWIVPLLAMGNIFLGIYYNLSFWYKITNRNMQGAYITLGGAAITILLNILLIPRFHYLGAAVATISCYLFMMIISYTQGQKYYPVPYARKKLIAYLVITFLLYLLHRGVVYLLPSMYASIGSGILLFLAFGWFIGLVERRELQQMPLIGKYYRKN